MKRLSILAAALAIAVAGCGSDNPTGSTGLPTTVVFTAALATTNEVPPITNAEAGGSGTATMTFHLTRDSSGNVTAATVDFLATYTGFPPGTVVTLSHIHEAAAGVNGSVVVNTAIAAGEVTFPNGTGSLVKNGVVVAPVDVATRILANPAGFYFNSHTGLNPGGVVRGQLRAQ
jgi:hypothetical protein